MSNEHTFTMTDRQKKRYAVEQHNLRYEAAQLRAFLDTPALQQGSNTGKSVTTDTLLDHLGIKAKIDPQDLPESVEITPAVSSANEEFQAIDRSQRDHDGHRVVVLGAGGNTGLGSNVAKRLAFATPAVLADMGKQQAREEICQLLIDEGDQKKFVDYLATLSGISLGDTPLRKLKLPKLSEIDPKEIQSYAEMYEDTMREVHGLPKREGAPDYLELLNKGERLVDIYSKAEPGFTPPGKAAKRMLSEMALTKAVEIIQDKLY